MRLALLQKTLYRAQENSRQPVMPIALFTFDVPRDSLRFGETKLHID